MISIKEEKKLAVITTLSPVQIRTIQSTLPTDVGLTGMAILNPAAKAGLHSYHILSQVARDFDTDSAIYQQASVYFQGNGGLFQVIDYATASASSNSGVTTFTPSSGASSGSADSNSTSSSAANTSAPTDADNAAAALTKYYYAGWEYLLLTDTVTNRDFITQIAKLINDQSRKILIVDIPTDTNTPDFSWIAPFKEYNSVFVVSGLKSDDYQFGTAFLSEFCTTSPMANAMYVPNLDQGLYNVKPQVKYEFTDAQRNKYYNPYHVATLAYTLGDSTGLTDNHVTNVMQFSTPRVRDYISDRMQTTLTQVLRANYESGLPYDAKGITLIQKNIDMILADCLAKGYIDSYKLHDIDVSQINEYKKISGELQLPGYEWVPKNNINSMTIVQDILVPADE